MTMAIIVAADIAIATASAFTVAAATLNHTDPITIIAITDAIMLANVNMLLYSNYITLFLCYRSTITLRVLACHSYCYC